MKVDKIIENGSAILAISGRLDTQTAPQLDTEISGIIEEINELVFDFKDLEYISSAGLRVILKTQKAMNTKGSMKIKNVNESVMEVFDITGFVDILTIE